jgi:hypothetical protein
MANPDKQDEMGKPGESVAPGVASPSQTALDGARQPNGRFAPGNRCGKGNAVARKASQFRAKLFSATSVKEFDAIRRVLVEEALARRPWAVKLFLSYMIGEPQPMDVVETIEKLEEVLGDRLR